MDTDTHNGPPNTAQPVLYLGHSDLPYEEDLVRQPYSVRGWQRYLDEKSTQSPPADAQQAPYFQEACVIYLYERALLALPGSYKLWKSYLDFCVHLSEPLGMERDWQALNLLYERALMFLGKMPRMWLDYLALLIKQGSITSTRQVFNRALRALPVSQHDRLWELLLSKWINHSLSCQETKLALLRRYLQFNPSYIEDVIEYCLGIGRKEEAIYHYLAVLNNPTFRSSKDALSAELWKNFIELVSSSSATLKETPWYVKDKESVFSKAHVVGKGEKLEEKYAWPVEAIFKFAMRAKLADQLGWLWSSLATYFVRLGLFQNARAVYEEGLASVTSVRDFSQIFDAYAKFEESFISKKLKGIERAKRGQAKKQTPANSHETAARDDAAHIGQLNQEVDVMLLQLEQLILRRPFILNDVMLRQSPNNVLEWEKRIQLCGHDKEKIVETYTRAVTTIDPKKASGRLLSQLWTSFARFYQDDLKDVDAARQVYEKAVLVPFKTVHELAEVWIEYANFEKSHSDTMKAIECLSRATKPLKGVKVNYHDENEDVQVRLFKSIKVWLHLIQLEKELGSVSRVRAAYDRVLELKIANPQTIFDYAAYLETQKYFEDGFRIYETGIALFGYPIAFDIWNVYLVKFMDRYKGAKLERARDLFEQALVGLPPKFAKSIYVMYGSLEEQYGLVRSAMKIYDRATKAVSDGDRYAMYLFYIGKAVQTYGVTAARGIYDAAIRVLPDRETKDMCLQYAEMEAKLGEVERARALFAYGSQFCDPRVVPHYWATWQGFEVKYGSEDTFREMLRVKRSVQATFHTDLPFVSAGLAKPSSPSAASSEEIRID